MIQVQSWLKPKDNSGASFVECIRLLGGFNRKFSFPGEKLRLVRKVRIGQIHLALFIRSKKQTRFSDGSSSWSEENAVILMNRKKRVLGTRLFGWVSRKLRRKKFLRILLLCGRHIL